MECKFALLPGLPKVEHLESAAGAGDVTAELKTPANHLYIVVGGTYWHDDDAAGRVAYLLTGISGSELSLWYASGVTHLRYDQIFDSIRFTAPLYLPEGHTLQFKVDAIAVGKKAYMRVMYHDIRGMEVWSDT